MDTTTDADVEIKLDFLKRIADAEDRLSCILIFFQETGEEMVLHNMSLDEAALRYPECRYSHSELVKDQAYYEWQEIMNDYKFWKDTKDMDPDELDDYLESLNHDYDTEDLY
jgi:hypothetical protein